MRRLTLFIVGLLAFHGTAFPQCETTPESLYNPCLPPNAPGWSPEKPKTDHPTPLPSGMQAPSEPPAPTQYSECTALRARWAPILERISQLHAKCLGSTKGDFPQGKTCAKAACQHLHSPTAAEVEAQRALGRCQSSVAQYLYRRQTGTEANAGPGYGPNPQPPRLPTQGADPASGFGQGPSAASAANEKQLAKIKAQQNVLREQIRIYEEGLADRDALAKETLAGEGTFLGIPSRYLGLAKSVSAASDLALDAYAEADPTLGGEFLKGVTTIIKGGMKIANEEGVSDRLITTVGLAGSVKVGDKNVHGMFGAGAAGAKLGLAVSQGRWADAVSEARNAGAIYAELAGNAKLSKGLGLVSSADEIMAGFRDYAESVDQMKKLEERGWEQSYQDKINKAFDRYLELERKRLQLESGVLENLRTGSSAPFGGLR